MDTHQYRSMMEKIDQSSDVRLAGLWILLGEKIEIATDPNHTERDTAMFEQLLTKDPAAAPLLRETVEYSPDTKKISFSYSEEKPDHTEAFGNPHSFDYDGSSFHFLLTKAVEQEMCINFWKR